MAFQLHARAARPGQQHGFAESLGAASAPPPSTLAAQLVENISASATKSSRPDETTELKRLFATIEKVKNDPDCLMTHEERVQHNHLLVYVCGGVFLESLKLDDAFADRERLEADALKAVNFLEVTIKETPTVLKCTTDGETFLGRGREPLWVWILPKLLRMLGHRRCLGVSRKIEELCRYMLVLAAQDAALWDLGRGLMDYLRTNLGAILARLELSVPSPHERPVEIKLPPKPFLEALADGAPRGCSFALTDAEHAIRHAVSLLTVIKGAVTSKSTTQAFLLYGQTQVWLLDTLQPLSSILVTWPTLVGVTFGHILEIATDLVEAHSDTHGSYQAVYHKASAVLVAVCAHLLQNPKPFLAEDDDSISLRRRFCFAFIQLAKAAAKHAPTSRLIACGLITPAQRLASEHSVAGAGTDIWRSVQLLREVTTYSPPGLANKGTGPSMFVDVELRQQVKKLVIGRKSGNTMVPPAKRRKLNDQQPKLLLDLTSQVCRLVNADPDSSMDELEPRIIERFPHLDEDDQCRLIDIISRIPCAADYTLQRKRTGPPATPAFQCAFCSKAKPVGSPPELRHEPAKSAGVAMFSHVIKLPSFLESRRLRVFAMIALRRIARHSTGGEIWDLEKSGPGQGCLQSLQSSIRELRIAAGRALIVFVSEPTTADFDWEVLKRNRTNALSFLKSLSDKAAQNLQETCIMAWAQVGKAVSADELNLVVIKLVEYLGHRNMVLSGLAFNEILNLAEFRGETPVQLFQPFWPSLAFCAVKDLVSKPQTARLIADLMQMSVLDLLLTIQKHALPWLVLTKKREVIQKITEARGETETWQTCMDPANLPCILALLLVQDAPDIAAHAMSLLGHVSSHIDRFELVELLRTDPLTIALELFKAGSGANEARRERVRAALYTMATLLLADQKERKTKKSDVVGRYLQQHALGLTARLSEEINGTWPSRPLVSEQRKCLGAMEEMIKICKSYMCIARPQISACLISALASDDLRTAAFSCWEAMLTHMEDADLEAQIETTFFIIGYYWKTFDSGTKKRAHDLITAMLKDYEALLKKYSNRLPSLQHIEELTDICKALEALRPPLDNREAFAVFAQRLSHENPGVIEQALVELVAFLDKNQKDLQASAVSEQPDSVVTTLARSLLDCSAKYNGWHADITRLCAQAMGLIGCLDSNRIETTREEKQFVVVHNFTDARETTDFVAFMLENVLVKAFLSTTDTKFQGFLSYAMQELLERTDFKFACAHAGEEASEPIYRKWLAISDSAREVLTPFLSSRFAIAPMPHQTTEYPIFKPGRSYAAWLRAFVLDLLRSPQNPFSMTVFEPLCRLIKVKDLAVTEFLLPYVVLHVVVGQEESDEFRNKVSAELAAILKHQPAETASYVEKEEKKLFYQAVFRILDYCMRWMQAKNSQHGLTVKDQTWIGWVQGLIGSLDAELISQRAVDCNEYARALFFLEPHIESREKTAEKEENDRILQSLQNIYTQIDDPDGLEGVSAHLQHITLDQQALNHRKAGRWTAAQTWYEIRLAECPDDADIQVDLLTCLKESGQHDVLLNYVEGMTVSTVNRIAPFAVEAAWATGRWQTLEKYLRLYNAGDVSEVFDLGVGQALLCLKDGNVEKFKEHIQMLRDKVAGSLTYSATSSLRASHNAMLKCHVLSDLEMIANENIQGDGDRQAVLTALDRRLEVLGAYVSDKQYLLGIRRAAMELMRPKFGNEDISLQWLSSARLARKSGSMHQSFNAVLHAQQLGDGSAIIENARLLYKDGHHRKAIQILQHAISTNTFISDSYMSISVPPTSSKGPETQRSLLTARAHLLLAKWLDSTGQTHASALRSQYQQAAKTHPQWEKGHYYLGRHYKKVLDSEKALKPDDQSDEYLSGETAKLVIENYLRSLNFGTKYLSQTLPRILTLFLELGAQVDKAPDGKISLSRQLHMRRKAILHELYKHFQKNIARMPAYIFYTSLPQIVARIAHPNRDVFKVLEQMILKVVEAHPRQALWSLFPLMTTRQDGERRIRGSEILQAVRGIGKNVDSGKHGLGSLLRAGEKLAEQLLLVCNNGDFQSNRTTTASITRDLNFNHKCTPCPLVVPVEACLTATLPTLTDNVRKHKAFSRDVITIDSFLDQVLVLGSLAKPRKLTARGTDGKLYGLLIKPKDDLRTDQRLMEFNSLINRSLKRDAESSRRQLYIRTYAVTPLNEECGIIEWVEGLKTLRDILLGIYKTRGIQPNYSEIQQKMKQATLSDANTRIFTEDVLGQFPPVLPEWFIAQFPNPSAWFAARLKYTRSCAVMSMVGTILGLGDRHGENVLLEEGNGGIFHVDFNCLFDKGLTFAQPERVPFRLTHNMEAAMGIYRYEGPFRHCSELTLRILRQQEETLMTILEAFIYDPTLDLQKSRKRNYDVVKMNPPSVVESIRRKVRGLLPEESIPLGVEGQVEELIKQAVNPKNLAAMYIGWCPFL
ncbi:phosphatidyl inositol 3-kinase-like protein [Parathielavia appendiculata]|uniref:Serine/threonine-protein kinase MEC1 n=1 Tax=Parathielavia appendiculata TaxID=2587402 RepID=A0AAN6U2J3_9PEZI|nr:phosphatidyl inositol 3-kinase-like protein [Parathielavia appendiculata]